MTKFRLETKGRVIAEWDGDTIPLEAKCYGTTPYECADALALGAIVWRDLFSWQMVRLEATGGADGN